MWSQSNTLEHQNLFTATCEFKQRTLFLYFSLLLLSLKEFKGTLVKIYKQDTIYIIHVISRLEEENWRHITSDFNALIFCFPASTFVTVWLGELGKWFIISVCMSSYSVKDVNEQSVLLINKEKSLVSTFYL